MKLFHALILASALMLPFAGCGGSATGEAEAPTDVSKQPDGAFSGGSNDLIDTEDGKAALTAPPIDLGTESGGR